VLIDFAPVKKGEMKILDYARPFTIDDLRHATNTSIDFMLDLIENSTDEMISFIPYDPEANDPYAPPELQNVGWSLGHLVAHVTASSEEWATYSSILARGIIYPAEPRLRYETDWETITTRAQAVQRLEESRRMRLGYLDTWPDRPHLNVLRQLSPRYVEKFGEMNAPACFLFGLYHEVGHQAQFKEVYRQAREAAQATAGAD
jgi:hypothetical protein